MPIVKMPDGTQVRFPDNMPPEQIRGMIEQKFPDAGKQFNPIEAAQGGVMQGMTFGFNDEIQAGMMTPIEMGLDLVQGKGWDPGRAFNSALDKTRGTDAMMQEQQPWAYTAGNIAGGVGSGVGLAKGGVTLMAGAKPTIASMAGRGAAEGAIYGGLHGLGTGTDDKVGDAVSGAVTGGIVGGVLGGVGGAVASRSSQNAIPGVQSLKDEAGALYETARQSGAVLPRAQSMNMASDVRAIAAAEGIVTPTGRINESFPKIADLIRSFDDYATGDLTIDQMQSVRRLIQNALRSTDADERRIAMMAMETFHKYLDPLAPEIAKANQIYHRAMNADVLETLIDVARQKTGQYGRSFDATLREQFGALERQIIKGEVRGFSQAEIEAISQVAQGGNLENALRLLGKAAPSGLLSGATSLGGPVAVGTMIGNPVAGAAVGAGLAGTGMAARAGANAITRNSARQAVIQSLLGSNAAPAANPAIAPIVQALIAGEGTQVPKVNPAIARALALN